MGNYKHRLRGVLRRIEQRAVAVRNAVVVLDPAQPFSAGAFQDDAGDWWTGRGLTAEQARAALRRDDVKVYYAFDPDAA